MLCYKIVQQRADGNLWSIFCHRYDVKYIPGQDVEPKIGKLFVYLNIEDAIDSFAKPMLQLWECDAPELERVRSSIVNPNKCDFIDRMESFWNKICIDDPITAPRGSFFTSKIRLINRIMICEETWRRV